MELNTILIILGVATLIILVAHGVWSSRREQSRYFKSAETFTKDSRLQNRKTSEFSPTLENPPSSESDQPVVDHRQQTLHFDEPQESHSDNYVNQTDHIKIHLPESNMTATNLMPKENASTQTIGELEKFSDEEYGVDTHSTKLREQLAELGRNEYQAEQQTIMNSSTADEVTESCNDKPTFLTLYIVAPEGLVFQGAQIAKTLDELGFLFGENNIYHRHSDLSINSPVLFSLANIEQPGTFHYNMQDFSTVGLALFIQFPSEGSDLMNLRMMIRAAKSIAEALDGFILTAEQKLFDEKEEARYLDSIR